MPLVYGTTLDPASQDGADVAAALAAAMGRSLRLVHVSEDTRASVVLGTDEERVLGPVRQRLNEQASRLAQTCGIPVHTHLAAGLVVDALVTVAQLEQSPLLVLGASRGSGPALLGRTAERVAWRAVCPVLSLREPQRLRAWLRGERALTVVIGANAGRGATAARAFAAGLERVGPVRRIVVQIIAAGEAHARLALGPPADDHSLAPEAYAALHRELLAAAPEGEGPVDLRIIAARGGADAHLVQLADQEEVDLVVVGQRRTGLVEHLWYGSVSRAVLRASPVSVACVPPLPLVEARPPTRPRVLLVATALDDAGERALDQALAIAGPGEPVHLVHVLPEAAPGIEARQAAASALARLLGERRRPELQSHLLVGTPVEQILGLASRLGVELIVLGTGPRGSLRQAVLGSTARALGEACDRPLLLVPAPPR